MNYPDVFSKLSEQIEDADLDVVEAGHTPGQSAEAIQTLLNAHGVTVDAAIIDFYESIGSAKAEWHIDDDADFTVDIWGTYNILKLEECLKGPSNRIHVVDEMAEGLQQALKALRPFDFFDRDESGCACFRLEGSHVPNSIWYYKLSSAPECLNIGIEEYIRWLSATKGYYGWHGAIGNPDAFVRDDLRQYLPRLFEGSDISILGS